MRVLLGTDGSPDAVHAADSLARFPLPAESPILVVSVLPHLGSRAAEHEDAMHAQARPVLEDERLKLAPWAVDVRLMKGGVRDLLLQTAEAWEADLLVLGARGLTLSRSRPHAYRRELRVVAARSEQGDAAFTAPQAMSDAPWSTRS